MSERRGRLQPRTMHHEPQEVSSKEWEFINMSEQEEDLICRMYRLVGDKQGFLALIISTDRWLHVMICALISTQTWALIAGRIPGRKPEEIERYWMMRYDEAFAEKRLKREKVAESGCSDGTEGGAPADSAITDI